MSAVTAPVVVPAGVTSIVALTASTSVAQSPTQPQQSTLPPPATSADAMPTLLGPKPADAAAVKELLVKARAALAEGKQDVATQALAQATVAGQAYPAMASELQLTRKQFTERGVSSQALDAAIKLAQQPNSGLNSRAASALQRMAQGNNAPAMQAPATLPQAPNTLAAATPTAAGFPAPQGPAFPGAAPQSNNPLRDQASGLAAQAKLALDRGDTVAARGFIEQANSLRVPDSEFAPGQLRPWSVALEIDKIDRLRSGSQVTTASANVPTNAPAASPFATASGTPMYGQNSGSLSDQTDNVQRGIYQPNADGSRVAQASANTLGNALAQVPDQSGPELYQLGITALSAGNKEAAIRHFKDAWKKESELDPGMRAQLKDKLSLLQLSERQTGEPESIQPLSAANAETQQKRQRLFAEVSGEIADAERIVNDRPMDALDKLRTLRQRVSSSEVDGAYRKQLLATIDRVTNNIEEWVKLNKSTIELDERNRQIEDRMAVEAATRAKTDAQVQTLVDQYNELIDKARYPEAEAVAKQVAMLKPNTEIAVVMIQKAKLQSRIHEQEAIQALKEENTSKAWNNVELAATPMDDSKPFQLPSIKEWVQLTETRLKNLDESTKMSPSERRIRETLGEPFSASFDRRPLSEAMQTISEMTGLIIDIDAASIAEEGLTIDHPITLDLRGNSIQLKSALNLILEKLNLTYAVKNEVLTIQSSRFTRRQLIQKTYSVKDLVIPVPNFISDYNSGMAGAIQAAYQAQTNSVAVNVKEQSGIGVASDLASVDPNSGVLAQMNNMGMGGPLGSMTSSSSPGLGFGTPGLAPGSSNSAGGAAIANFRSLIQLIETTISPEQWQSAGGTATMMEFRQNLSLIVNAPQETHEQIADLLKSLRALQNLQVTIEVRFITLQDTFFERIGIDFDFNIDDAVRRIPREDSGPSVAVGLSGATGTLGPQLTSDLDVQVRQGSFGVNSPFGSPDITAGTTLGLAILSDLELFFFLQAAQGNSRQNVLQAPKVTMFDGQAASITDVAQRPFVVSFEPVVGDFAVAQRPIVIVLNEGTQMNVQSVVSQDKRFVRLTLVPQFTRLESTDREFTFTGRRSTRTGTSILNPNGTPSGTRDDEEAIIEGTTVQQPTFGVTSVNTTVSVPDGGTILLGGIKRLREGRTERGTPILSKIPYINRLFKNTAIGRETNTLMMTVTPRIIIPEEEEEALGVNLPKP